MVEVSTKRCGKYRTLAPNPEIRCAERERERFLREAIAGLRPRFRRTLEFYTLQDHSLRETAAQIGISVTATKTRLFHAKAALRKSKALRKISEPNWHGLEAESNLTSQESALF